MSIAEYMVSKLLVTLVGMAMGGLSGLLVAFVGAGNPAIVVGALVGGVLFVLAAPRLNRSSRTH